MTQAFKPALILLLAFSVITGVLYPLLVTLTAQLLMPAQANGSLVMKENHPVGSALIGQPFSRPEYFWGRPSATSPNPYNAGASSGSNVGPSNPALVNAVKARISTLQAADPDNKALIPIDLITASASGLDPHISPAAAEYQVLRVAKARNMAPDQIRAVIQAHTEGRHWGLLGEPRVNVLAVNWALSSNDSPVVVAEGASFTIPPSKVYQAHCKQEALRLHPGQIQQQRMLRRHSVFWVEAEIRANDGSEWLVLCDLSNGTITREQKLDEDLR